MDYKQKLDALDLPKFIQDHRITLLASKTTNYNIDYDGFKEYAYPQINHMLANLIKTNEEDAFISSLLFVAKQWNELIIPDVMIDDDGGVYEDCEHPLELLLCNKTWVMY